MPDFHLRPVRREDAPAIAAIYAPYVTGTVITFEEAPPAVEEIVARITKIAPMGLPYWVAETAGGMLLGYAYAGPFHARAAYRHTVENSVYVAQDAQGRGVGTALMRQIIADCEAADCRQMVALISGQEAEASIALHTRLGFATIGTLRAVGFKFGRWIDVVQMQRALGAGDTKAGHA